MCSYRQADNTSLQDMMEPLLLLLSLFITHLAVGGELLQYSTATVHVSANGTCTDSSGCLNDDYHCKTLGYVLAKLNVLRLQCTNCTIVVTYDHDVNLPTNCEYKGCQVHIGNVEFLYIVGLGQPSLYFHGSGLQLIAADHMTSVIIEDVVFSDCGHAKYSSCIHILDHYLLELNVTNVMLKNTGDISVAAQYVYWQHSNHYNASYLWIQTPDEVDSETVVMNTTFSMVNNNGYIIHVDFGHGHPSLIHKVYIQECHFNNHMHNGFSAITLESDIGIYSNMDLVVEGCMYQNCMGIFIFLEFEYYVIGELHITNNHLVNNTCLDRCISISFHTANNCQYNNLTIYCHGNVFVGNHGVALLSFQMPDNYCRLNIGNSTIIDNVLTYNAVYLEYNSRILCNQSVQILIMHDLLLLNNSITGLPTAYKGSIIAIQNYLSHTLKIDVYNLNFTKKILVHH